MSQNTSRGFLLYLAAFAACAAGISSFVQGRWNHRQDERLSTIEQRAVPAPKAPEPKPVEPMAYEEAPPPPAVGDVLRIRMEDDPPDEQYRDMTVLKSASHAAGTPCLFSRLREELKVLEVRDTYVLVEYVLHGNQEEIRRQRDIFFPTTRNFCASGDIGIITADDFERYRVYERVDVQIREEQRDELARIREAFPELPAPPAEGP